MIKKLVFKSSKDVKINIKIDKESIINEQLKNDNTKENNNNEKEKEKQNEKISFTGIRHLLKKKDKKNNDKKKRIWLLW